MSAVTRILLPLSTASHTLLRNCCRWCTTRLRKLAAQKLAHEKPCQTLQATDLVHEAYLRLVDTVDGRTGTAEVISSRRRLRLCAFKGGANFPAIPDAARSSSPWAQARLRNRVWSEKPVARRHGPVRKCHDDR